MADEEYVLITAASNEEATIGMTIRAVAAQTRLPQKWIIVVNESRDRTLAIVEEEARKHGFIEAVHLQDGRSCNFGAKVRSVDVGYEKLGEAAVEFVGILDADITFEADYYEKVLERMAGDPGLGIAGGVVAELDNGKFRTLDYNLNSVAGAVQMFRRACYDRIGGYVMLEYGGIDAVAEAMARMEGWRTRTFRDLVVNHHRKIGRSRSRSLTASYFNMGRRNYFIGLHPFFFFLKCVRKMAARPFVVGGILMMAGYFWPLVTGKRRKVSAEFVRYYRSEQKKRIQSSVIPFGGGKGQSE